MEDLNNIIPTGAYLLALVLGFAIFSDVRHDICRLVSGRNVVLGGMVAWYVLEALMLPSELRVYNQAQYDIGIMCVALALAGFLLGYHYTPGCSFFSALSEKITFFDNEQWLWRLVLIGAAIGFAPVIYYTGTDIGLMLKDIMGQRATWGGVLGRGRYGDARAAFLMMEVFVSGVAPFAAILLFKRSSPFPTAPGGLAGPGGPTVIQRLFCALVVFWPIIRAYGSGTRSSMITAAAAGVVVFYWKASTSVRKKMIYACLLCLPLFYAFMAALVISRSSGSFSWEDREKAEYVGNEMFRELLFITSKVPSARVDFQYGYIYYVQLVNPIPRFLWPSKPTLDAGILMANVYGSVNTDGEAFLTISPGLIGEMYLNFGLFGIVGLSAFGGWLVKGWDLIPLLYGYSLPALMYYSGGLAVLFIMGRSFTMNMFYGLLSLAVLAWWIRYCNPHEVDRAAATDLG